MTSIAANRTIGSLSETFTLGLIKTVQYSVRNALYRYSPARHDQTFLLDTPIVLYERQIGPKYIRKSLALGEAQKLCTLDATWLT